MTRRFGVVVLAALCAHSLTVEAASIQTSEDFAAALANRSTEPSYVRVTVIDDRSNVARTGCVLAPFLVGAMRFELGSSNAPANAAIIAAKGHVFHFRDPRALANVWSELVSAESDQACQMLEHVGSAYMADRTGQVRPGRPF